MQGSAQRHLAGETLRLIDGPAGGCQDQRLLRPLISLWGVIALEMAPRQQIFTAPKHPYTKALLSAVPVPEPGAVRNPIILKGDVPSPINPPSGCRFNTRCPFVFDRCKAEEPELRSTGDGQWVACHLGALPEAPGPAR